MSTGELSKRDHKEKEKVELNTNTNGEGRTYEVPLLNRKKYEKQGRKKDCLGMGGGH